MGRHSSRSTYLDINEIINLIKIIVNKCTVLLPK